LIVLVGILLGGYLVVNWSGMLSLFLDAFHHIYRTSSFVHAVGRTFADYKLPKHLHPLANVEKVSNRVYRVLGQNPGTHTLHGTNTWLIVDEQTDSHVLVDTGEDVTSDKYVNLLFNTVFEATKTKRLSHILLSHGHGDHQGGVIPILEELKKRNMLPLPTIYKRNISGGEFPARGFECRHIEEHQVFSIGEHTTIQAVYTPGHTDDHVAFIIAEDQAILTGDCVLGCGTTVFDDLFEYMKSLEKLRQLIVASHQKGGKEGLHTIYPGHGPVIRETALQKITEYIDHRNERESQILKALADNAHKHQKGWISSWELVPIVYGDLNLILRVSAQRSLTHHLKKLLQEGKVQNRFPDQWSASV